MNIWAVRGATTITVDRPDAVKDATRELLIMVMNKNGISPENIVSIIFTVTEDIVSEFPAVAARDLGLTDTPLICAREIPKSGSLPRCIRLLIHFYTDLTKGQVQSVYLNDAVNLRPDLNS